jgi:hypothetical protein
MLRKDDKCLVMTDSWASIQHYKIIAFDGEKIDLREFRDYFGTKPVRTLKRSEENSLFSSPYQPQAGVDPDTRIIAELIRNLASSWMRTEERFPITELLNTLVADERLRDVSTLFIEGCVRSCIASDLFSIWWDKRRKEKVYSIELSPEMAEQERNRSFAGSFAAELSELSERIRLLVKHTSTVGTYRENLLQTLLRKNLPERYHVATGFIYGCPRQLDIVIYDRLEYAPLLREGDLVVVPVESVRAVIEVKTDLTKQELDSSLELLDDVAAFDDGRPPFFRGIFGFESSLTPENIYAAFVDFHVREPEVDSDSPNNAVIWNPYQHVTSVCVLGHAYACVDYVEDSKNELTPTLVTKSSATGLKAQAAYFLQLLLAYLRYGGLKRSRGNEITEMLGADTLTLKIGKLTPLEHWGAYFSQEEGMDDSEDDVKKLEAHVRAVQGWLGGQIWPFGKS